MLASQDYMVNVGDPKALRSEIKFTVRFYTLGIVTCVGTSLALLLWVPSLSPGDSDPGNVMFGIWFALIAAGEVIACIKEVRLCRKYLGRLAGNNDA